MHRMQEQAAGRERRQPVLLTAMGRSGTTLLMKYLSLHPEIIAGDWYPYEFFPAAYWVHLSTVLSRPADWQNSTKLHPFGWQDSLIGSNPFFHPHVLDSIGGDEIHHFFEQHYPQKILYLSLESIERIYDILEQRQGKSRTRFFAEKVVASPVRTELLDTFKGARELLLVRDFRDSFSSAIAFNAKNGRRGMGLDYVADEIEWVRWWATEVSKLIRVRDTNPDALLVRYEDLVLRPAAILQAVFRHIGADAAEGTIATVLGKTARSERELHFHQTAPSPAESIGRWRSDLPEPFRGLAEEQFQPALKAFGYLD